MLFGHRFQGRNPLVDVMQMNRPLVKPEHTAYRAANGAVRIGGTLHGIAAEVDDPEGWVWTLVSALDGTNTPAAAVRSVTDRHPNLADVDVAAALQQLLESGFLEDAAAPAPKNLGDRDRERHSRSMTFFRWIDRSPRRSSWDIQAGLRASRVLLIGLGGTGGTLAHALAASGVGRLHCVDDDLVELSNLNRQILYTERDIGRSKVEAAVSRLRSVNSDIEVTGEEFRVTDQGDITRLLTPGFDLLALCADKPRNIRRWANRACLANGIPWVTGGYQGPIVTAGIYVPGQGACWECLHDQESAAADLQLPPDLPAGRIEPHLPWGPVNAVSSGLSGTLLAHAALSVLTGAPPIEPGVRFGVNLVLPGEAVLERFPRLKGCPSCGDST
jgi:molybdopterin/thiamine biosynthesis adenylyltransferase